jgi:hypothetical protein
MPSTPENNDPLDALLRENDAHVDDAGFTARVMESLPPRRRSWLRPVILCGATFIGLILLVWFAPIVKDAFQFDANGAIALNFNSESLVMLAVFATGAASLAWGVFSVLKWED